MTKMMRSIICASGVMGTAFFLALGNAFAAESEHFTMAVLDEDADLVPVLAEQARIARDEGRKPFLYFWADWCPPCVSLRDSLDNEIMIDAFKITYIVQADFDKWQDRLSDTAYFAGFDGIPAFVEIYESGQPNGRAIDGGARGEDIPRNMAPPLKSYFSGED